ncbi:hypothetical protein HPB50_000420 [Hyalomma asiaticum]|uniref:Uncharacterized protein n=1 Tax=Hyalomma asiaticum TaxID=266040 RepID=A0ACB7RLH6_HYAAI|nr:hypothetical protein HPB50_000420 [Hyalomma asiaticum]
MPGLEVASDVCPSMSDWVCLTTAQDPYGTTLKVLDTLEYNGTIVRQYFYETFCAFNQSATVKVNRLHPTSVEKDDADIDERHECLAVDKKMWHSRCRERMVWTYGMVVKADGDVGWGVIAIRGSCTCSVWPRRPPEGHRPLMRLFIDDV